MKLSVTLLFLLLATAGFAQTNVLSLYKQQHYNEIDEVEKNSTFTLRQEVNYNDRRVIDEEHTYLLRLFFNSNNAPTPTVLNVATDTAIVKLYYNHYSVWDFNDDIYKFTGTIEILKWTKKAITLKEDITVTDAQTGEAVCYKGELTFYKSPKLIGPQYACKFY